MNNDLLKMKPVIYNENKVFCLTSEIKMEKWIKTIKDKVKEGNIVKLYSDIESTGFAYWKRGRAIYDPNMDKKLIQKDAEKFFIPINAYKNDDFKLKLNSSYCSNSFFMSKEISTFALLYLNFNLLSNKNNELMTEFQTKLDENRLSEEDILTCYNEFINKHNVSAQTLKTVAYAEIIKLQKKAFVYLEKETIKLSGKIDRMIEFAFVACYENKDGEVLLLKDDEDDLVYFHEFVYPNEDGKSKQEQIIDEMPIIPYLIHKTNFDFLKGNIEHPFLHIKLDKKAPNSGDIFRYLLRLFDVKNETEEHKKMLTDNIIMFYHNGNGFDVPFLDAEMDKFFEHKKMRDFTKIFDTLKIAKEIIPSDIQKFIAACQHNKNFGGNESLKTIESVSIAPTSKSLDNIKRLASFLNDFDLEKPNKMYKKGQEYFFNEFKKYFEKEKNDWNKYENMVEYNLLKNIDIDLKKGFPKATKGSELDILLNRYLKFLEGKKEYLQSLNKIKKYENIYKNLYNIKNNIDNNIFLKEALYRLNNVDRTAHGARVDSQLFMDAFIVLENALYLKPKISKSKRSLNVDDLKIPNDIKTAFEKLINKK